MRRALAFAALPAVLLAGRAAYPCGAPFGANVAADPHQDIIVAWKNDVETYVFQPTFCGTATDFGLLLPVPSPLVQQPAQTDPQAFTTAAVLSEPTKKQVTEHGSVGCMAGDSLGAGSKNASDDGTTVIASGRVGFLDWVQLKADDVAALTDWLGANGYPYSTAASTVFSYYVQKSWYFIAFRISQDAVPGGGTVCRALGPVSLSFPAPKPVIPSRMATAGNTSGSGRYAWRIFGITSGDRQLVPGNASAEATLWYSGAIDAANAPAFAGLVEPGDRLTRFTFTFYGSSTEDVALATPAPVDYRGTETIVVHDDSCSVGHNVRRPHGGRLLLASLGLLALLGWRRRR